MAMAAGLSGRLAAYAPHSWRADAAVPSFPDEMPVIVFDGVCVMCSAFARFVARRDTQGRFRFLAAQSGIGAALYRHFRLDPADYETNLLLMDGRVLAKLEAAIAILSALGPGWRVAANLMSIPPPRCRDWLYDRLARNRYALFGRYDACIVPDASWHMRLIEDRAEPARRVE